MRLPTCDILPLEAVFAYVEVKTKLSGNKGNSSIHDCVLKAKNIREHTTRYFWVKTGRNKATAKRLPATSIRSYVFAVEGDGTAAEQLRKASDELGDLAELSGLFVNDQGYFMSEPNARPNVIPFDKDVALATFRNCILHDLSRFERYGGTPMVCANGDSGIVVTAFLDHYLPGFVRSILSKEDGIVSENRPVSG